ncbi:hypothetical protein [Pseudoalteromonas rhizosphaerae]|uniref:DUF4276 family protein n=1 Tax=Pseudoalteromonas rhizosphaerae TaxID=2518973 RepID=A0ABW8L376_9GAMM
MARVILFLFEGDVREINYFDSLQNSIKELLPQKRESEVICSFSNDLYQLYDEIKDDDDLNLVVLLQEGLGNKNNINILRDIDEDQVTDIYLFFDMEIQARKYSDESLLNMVKKFNDESNQGKIFISYPMVEAIRHIYDFDTFKHLEVEAANCRGRIYKRLSSTDTIQRLGDHTRITTDDWKSLVRKNIEKSHFMISKNCAYGPPPTQEVIANYQINRKNVNESIYVLSAFPFFAVDYYGTDLFSQ